MDGEHVARASYTNPYVGKFARCWARSPGTLGLNATFEQWINDPAEFHELHEIMDEGSKIILIRAVRLKYKYSAQFRIYVDGNPIDSVLSVEFRGDDVQLDELAEIELPEGA